MIAKPVEKEKAILLRRQGKSYSEIGSVVLVSQSTLSLWLRNVKLSKTQLDNLLLKKQAGQAKGALVKRDNREQSQKEIISKAETEISQLSRNEIFLLGVVAYWCEGSKQKGNNVSQGVVFANSDPFLLKLFVKWLKEICMIGEEQIDYSLYIHDNANVQKAVVYWSKILCVPEYKFGKPILKKHNILTKRKNIGDDYYGLIRISIRKSTNLNRKIKGWVSGIAKYIN